MTDIRVGIIGLDTSHVDAFLECFGDSSGVGGCRIVAAYPHGSEDIPSSVERVPHYVDLLKRNGITIADSIGQLLEVVDAVLLLTNDGRPHLRQALPCLAAGKRLFIDKPLAGSLVDGLTILRAADHFGVPTFSASALRFAATTRAVREGDFGRVLGADTYSHCALEPRHPDLFWYGIHGVEMLFASMGSGCHTVWRVAGPGADVAVGRWADGRIGTFRGTRTSPHHYGGTVFTPEHTQRIGPFDGYQGLAAEVGRFFQTGRVPLALREMLDVYGFMEAADTSKRCGGSGVVLKDVIREAEAQASRLDLAACVDAAVERAAMPLPAIANQA